jgi:hypothetical protein
MKAFATNVPYPPLFAGLFTIFTFFNPAKGFALWTLLNGAAAIFLAWHAGNFFQRTTRPAVALLLLTSYPLIYALVLGQPAILLACAVAEFYRALLAQKEFKAGCYLSVLLFKPQYGVLIGPIWRYPQAFSNMVGFRDDFPSDMINWRALILWLSPRVSNQSGMRLEMALGFLTVLVAALAWRGQWMPKDPRFSIQMSIALLATLIANHHSFQNGAVLLAAPLAAAVSGPGRRRLLMRGLAIASCLLPAILFMFVFPLDGAIAAHFQMCLLMLCFAVMLVCLWSESARSSRPTPVKEIIVLAQTVSGSKRQRRSA